MKDNTMLFLVKKDPVDDFSTLPTEATPLESPAETRTKIKKKNIINQLNYIHFNDGSILVKMKHKKYDHEISLEAKPHPCTTNLLECRWVQTPGLAQKLQTYRFDHFLLSDGLKLIRVEAAVQGLNETGITLDLPDFCFELSSRMVRRYPCTGIDVEFMQNGAVFYGRLIDFSAQALKIEILAEPPQTFQWIQPDQSAYLICKEENSRYFSGKVKILRHTHEQRKRHYVLKPVQEQINRFKNKQIRSLRYVLNPSPNVIFTHPLTKNVFNLPVYDLSGSGFSVEENYNDSVLTPGMIIPEVEIEIANNFYLRCFSQVVYRHKLCDEKKDVVKCGIAILDMDIQDQMKLAGILQRSGNKNSYVCNRVNTDNLWKFFFDAGFIYPEKYTELQYNKEEFKNLYENLYVKHPQIARHFIYQERGIIHGHISMLRYFTNTWLFHHHASNASAIRGPGLIVLNQICQYVNDFYQHYSTHMNYIACFYRSNNRFPSRIFGHFAEKLNDTQGCVIYPMAYFNYHNKPTSAFELPPQINLAPSEYEDLLEMKHSIGGTYSNLIFHAFDFEQSLYNSDDVSLEYQKAGFKREKHLYSCKINGQLKAVFLVLISETGINLSNLTNCIFAFVVDRHDFSKTIFYMILEKLKNHYKDLHIPVLIYPSKYATQCEVEHEKIYNLWIFNSAYLDEFLKFTYKIMN